MCLRVTFLSLLGEIGVLGGENKLRVQRAMRGDISAICTRPGHIEVLKARFELFEVRPVRGAECDYSGADRLPF